MKTKKVKPWVKVLGFMVVVALIVVVPFQMGLFDKLMDKEKVADIKEVVNNSNVPAADVIPTAPSEEGVIDVSLDEWIGWKSILDANGGLQTQPGSIYDKLGLKVNIHIINDATQSSNALIKGSLDGAGYTVNRYAFLYNKFKENKTPVVMPFITNSSTGGDGIIAKNGINRIEDLVGKKIAVPRFSEAQTLVLWLLTKSDLSEDQIAKFLKSTDEGGSVVYFDTPDDAAKAFFGGKVDAAATWQPYLGQAKEFGGHVLFDTKAAKNIILDGIVFRQEFVDKHGADVAKFVEGAIKAMPMYTTEFTAIKNSMPLFSTETNENIKGMTVDATLADYTANKNALNGTAQLLFEDMSNIWKALGESASPESATEAFDKSILATLSDKFSAEVATKAPAFTEAQREAAKAQDNNMALLQKKAIIQFQVGNDQFVNQDEALTAIMEFADIAKIMDGTIIQIEGNTSSEGDPAVNKVLSEKRAKAIATMLKFQGIDPSRFVVIGNGSDKPVGDNKTDAGKKANRRTEVFFKVVQ